MAQQGGGQGSSDIGDVLENSRSQALAGEDLEVVAVRPFASSTVAVVCIGRGVHVLASCPLEVGESDHVLERWKSAIGGDGSKQIINACIWLVKERASCKSYGREGED